MSTCLYGAHVHANGIRQHYLRYGGSVGGRDQRPAVIIVPGITSPAVTWGFVGEQFGQHFDTYIQDVRGRGLSEAAEGRSEEHTSELQSRENLVCRLLL